MTINGNKLTADDGKTLTNGETYSTEVYLGIYDKPENWREINIEDIPDESEEPEIDAEEYKTALEIILGLQ